MTPSLFTIAAFSGVAAVVLAAGFLRNRLFATFVAVFLGVQTLITVGIFEHLSPLWPLVVYLQACVLVHFISLSRARMRGPLFRALVTLPALTQVARRHPDLAVVHLDAHADMRADYLGNPLSHATVLRRVAEVVGFDSLRQIGIRSGTREEFALMREHGTQVPDTSREQMAAALDGFGDRPLYVTCDLDIFDPAHLPGTGTPEPGGIDFHVFATFVKLLAGRNIVGCDVVELAPALDPSGCSAVLAAKVTRELLLCIPAARR